MLQAISVYLSSSFACIIHIGACLNRGSQCVTKSIHVIFTFMKGTQPLTFTIPLVFQCLGLVVICYLQNLFHVKVVSISFQFLSHQLGVFRNAGSASARKSGADVGCLETTGGKETNGDHNNKIGHPWYQILALEKLSNKIAISQCCIPFLGLNIVMNLSWSDRNCSRPCQI